MLGCRKSYTGKAGQIGVTKGSMLLRMARVGIHQVKVEFDSHAEHDDDGRWLRRGSAYDD